MRHLTLATGLALAIATTFSLAPAKAEFVNSQGQCRQYGANNQNLTYYYWGNCPSTQVGPHGHVHVNGATHHHTHS
jgi:hypothetical protein